MPLDDAYQMAARPSAGGRSNRAIRKYAFHIQNVVAVPYKLVMRRRHFEYANKM